MTLTSETKPFFTLEQFQKATGATAEKAKLHYQAALNALTNFGLTSKEQIAAVLATASIESAKLELMREDLYYKDAERLAGLFKRVFDVDGDGKISEYEIEQAKPYTKNSAALNQKLYGGFCGRGPGQITWEGNYRSTGGKVGADFVKNPELLETPEWGWMAMAAFWAGLDLGAKVSDPKAVRRAWNGKAMLKLDEYTAAYNAALKVLG